MSNQAKLAYPTNRPFADRSTKKTAYKINRNTKFYKTLVDFQLHRLPVVELIYESYCNVTGKQVGFRGTFNDLLRNFDAYSGASRLVESRDRWDEGPIEIKDWTDGNMITMFFSKGESSNDKFLIVWEAAR